MSNTEVEATQPRSLVKGLVAGLVGGLVGTVAKTFAERLFPPRTHGEPEPFAQGVIAAGAIHWGYGAVIGAAYGVLAEYYPAATAKEGASFGMALEALTHESALPAIGFSAGGEGETLQERASEMTSHVVYGVAAEMVRGFVRKRL